MGRRRKSELVTLLTELVQFNEEMLQLASIKSELGVVKLLCASLLFLPMLALSHKRGGSVRVASIANRNNRA